LHKNIIGISAAFEKIVDEVNKVKDSNINIFIHGKSGTGKELITKAIYYRSPSGKWSFADINYGANPKSLKESELFGHEKSFHRSDLNKKRKI
jgi:two-component system response regulator PilR (NtrC family)